MTVWTDPAIIRAQSQFPQYFSDPTSIGDPLRGTDAGANILVRVGDRVSILKLKSWGTEFLSGDLFRHGNVFIHDGSNLLASLKGRPRPNTAAVRKSLVLQSDHRINFNFDPEFGVYLPSSSGDSTMVVPLTELHDSGVIIPKQVPKITSDEACVRATLMQITTPYYFEHVVRRFLENEPTHFKTPWGGGYLPPVWKRFARETRDIPHGGFVYVGCKEEVFLLGLAQNDGGSPYYQGTYLASTKPPLFFTNSYLGPMSPNNTNQTSDPPNIGGKAFVFPHIGRRQQCKYTAFTGSPQVITGSIDKALWHLQTTDFADQAKLVEQYAERIREIPAGYARTGKYFI